MTDRTRIFAAVALTVLLFLGVQLGALALVEPFDASDRQAVENPDDPVNSAIYFVVILAATGVMLAAFKYDAQWFIRALIIGVSTMLAWFVFLELLPPAVTVGSVNVLAALAAVAVGAALLLYPEWYVIDGAGVLMGAGAAGLFGISFGLLPAIIFLSVLAVYDAISVYKTEHMLDLAEGVMDLRIPVVLVVPTTLSYSYLASDSTDGVLEDEKSSEATPVEDGGNATADDSDALAGEGRESDDPSTERDEPDDPAGEPDAALERDALFIGLGDAVIPTILVASAASFLEVGTLDVPVLAVNVPALGAIVGTITGLLVLMYMVLQGRPHAGLPLLNGGAITGYLLGALASGLPLLTALGL
ncbi:presenilin family intramembrane aspartyl protease PSH [Natrialbaceae archaeon GCM10025810]|uniref:presenilin family intramembrane aspartyl protease PSH n=1 Tax=Halovalidus salilacus TaxID=3075124 RepID=UPI003607D9C3